MNPFAVKPEKSTQLFVDWEKLWVKPYDKHAVDPYTRTRVILTRYLRVLKTSGLGISSPAAARTTSCAASWR